MNTVKIIAKFFAAIALIVILATILVIASGLNILIPEPSQSVLSAPIEAIKVIVVLPELEAPVALVDYSKITTRDLRPMARDRHVPKWNKLNKQALIAALSA